MKNDEPIILPEDLTFEDASAEIEDIITKLENGSVTLNESIHLYAKGMALKDFCMKELEEAEKKVEQILIQKDGSAVIKPFDEGDNIDKGVLK